MSEALVLIERLPIDFGDLSLGLVTLNRPAQMNPIDWETIGELRLAMEQLANDPNVRAIAIIGAGTAFSAGGDLKKYIELQRNADNFQSFLDDLHSLFNFIQFDLPKPVLALINGVTAAGGLELALACDIVYASSGARIGDGHLNFGQMGGGGVLTRLPRRVLQNFGREVLFTGAFLAPEPWAQAGFVNRILPDRDALIAAAVAFAESVASKSPLAVANMKITLNRTRELPFKEAIAHEIAATHHYCLTSYDAPEGLNAFAEKRKPRFEGR